MIHKTNRRLILQSTAALSLLGAKLLHASSIAARARVVVIGGGFGGATAAKYIRLLSNNTIAVVLIEPSEFFISSPMSNLVISGQQQMSDITIAYDGLGKHHGITVMRDLAQSIDSVKKIVTLASGVKVGYDKLVVSPGVDMQVDQIEGYALAHQEGQIVHAWTGSQEIATLRQQLKQMHDGGTFAITIPLAPYRCPPAPYERASLVASYFKEAKPKSKVLILDANSDVTSQASQFKKAWAAQYTGILEYRPEHRVVGVDGKTGTIQFEVQDDIHADVINALPPMRAGLIAVKSGLANLANQHWCGVNFLTFESTVVADVFVLGDSIQTASLMPKSGQMASSQAKVAAAAIVSQLTGKTINPHPTLTNNCYSFISPSEALRVASLHEYVLAEKTFKIATGSGVSTIPSASEGQAAFQWVRDIWTDTFE